MSLNLILIVLAAWTAISVVVGILFGQLVKAGEKSEDLHYRTSEGRTLDVRNRSRDREHGNY